jgi:hypothetical protein
MTRPCSSRPRFALVAAALSALSLGLETAPTSAWAADSGPGASPAASESAEKLAEKAYELHGEGKFAEAIATYLKAYAISNAAAVLFNVAMIYDHKLHEPELAADYYRRYLGAPDVEPDLVQKANARLAALKSTAAPTAPAPAPATPPPPPPPTPTAPAPAPPTPTALAPATPPPTPPSSPWRTTGLVVAASGVAGLAASAVLAVVAKGKNDDANSLCNGAACSSPQGVMLAHDAGTFATASTVVFVAGAVLVAGGVVLYLGAPRSPPSAAWAVAPLVGRDGGGVSLRAGF